MISIVPITVEERLQWERYDTKETGRCTSPWWIRAVGINYIFETEDFSIGFESMRRRNPRASGATRWQLFVIDPETGLRKAKVPILFHDESGMKWFANFLDHSPNALETLCKIPYHIGRGA